MDYRRNLRLAFLVPLGLLAAACSEGEKGGGGASEPEPPSLDGALTSRFPAPGSSTCADTSLRMAFATAPTLGPAGKIRVFDAATPDVPAVEIDLAATAWR